MHASAIRSYLVTGAARAPWAEHVNGVGVVGGTQVEVDTDLADGATDLAVHICQVTSAYVYDQQHADDATISIQGRARTVLARRAGRAGSCSPGS
jgi:hypothetical protein